MGEQQQQQARDVALSQSLVTSAEKGPRLEIGGPDGMAVAVHGDGSRQVLIGPPGPADFYGAVECDLAQMAVVQELRAWSPAALTPVTNTGATEYERGVQAGVRIASERLQKRAREIEAQQ